MWLKFGENSDHLLVPISQVKRGKTNLRCPYCQGLLTAKKGSKIAHHFAHTEQTCRQVQGDRSLPVLPCYDQFNLHLSGKAYQELLRLSENGFYEPDNAEELLFRRCIQHNEWRPRRQWELTKLGKLARGDLSLMLFNQIQDPLLSERLSQFEEAVIAAKQKGSEAQLADALTDLRLYRAQYQRVLSQTLYFLEIQADGNLFHKIGVTTRQLSERIPEIERDLKQFYQEISIKSVGTWEHRGNVEPYFKYRYEGYQKKIGTLIEYFQFDEDFSSVRRDLRRMKPKMLSKVEQKLLSDDFAKVKHSLLTRGGMRNASSVGRPKDKHYTTLLKYPEVVKALEQGRSLRQISEQTGASINTIRKVKRIVRLFG